MNNELMAVDSGGFMPVMTMQTALARRAAIVEFVKQIMVKGTDYGTIPGTSKDVLFKPGAEKLVTFFGLAVRFEPVTIVEDWTGEKHNGEPFFFYHYTCELYRNGNLVGSGEGSCNSWEQKYRWRNQDRTCPKCGQPAIIKNSYGPGWLCYKKKGGCGAKFPDGDQAIESQDVSKVPNPNIGDQVNTILKMCQKRALIAAVLITVNASEFFTQDLEDMATGSSEGSKSAVDNSLVDEERQKLLQSLASTLYGSGWKSYLEAAVKSLTEYERIFVESLTNSEADQIVADLEEKIRTLYANIIRALQRSDAGVPSDVLLDVADLTGQPLVDAYSKLSLFVVESTTGDSKENG